MYAQTRTTTRITDAHAPLLTALATTLRDPEAVADLTGASADPEQALAAATDLATALDDVLAGSAATLAPPTEYVSLADVRAALDVQPNTLQKWMKRLGIKTYQENHGLPGYIARTDLETLRQWRIARLVPEVP